MGGFVGLLVCWLWLRVVGWLVYGLQIDISTIMLNRVISIDRSTAVRFFPDILRVWVVITFRFPVGVHRREDVSSIVKSLLTIFQSSLLTGIQPRDISQATWARCAIRYQRMD